MLANKTLIDLAPLQVYSSALTFAPEKSVIKQMFKNSIPGWVKRLSNVHSNWTAQIQMLEGHTPSVTAAVFSPDGSRLTSVSRDGTMQLWDATTGEILQTTQTLDLSWHVAFSLDGKKLASSDSTTFQLWDTVMGEVQLQHTFISLGTITALTLSPDSKKIILSLNDGTIQFWDTVTGKMTQILNGHKSAINDITLSLNGRLLASASRSDEHARL